MIRTNLDFEAWVEQAKSISVEAAAAKVGFVPRKGQGRARERSGPCPVCGGTDRFSIHAVKNVWHCRGCGVGGHDGIGLVMHGLKLDFLGACEAIEGPRPNPPDGESEADRLERRRRTTARLAEIDAARRQREVETDKADNLFREGERKRAFDQWRQGHGFFGSIAEAYLRARGLDIPGFFRARYHPMWTLWGDGDDRKVVVHRGPALFLPIVGPDGRFMGLHVTWFDPLHPGDKVKVPDESGVLVPAKKIRGLKKGGHIVIVEPREPMTRLITGEGAETVLTPWTALSRARSPLLDGCGFWTSVDLGNLGGKALDRLRHPTETRTDKAGRISRVKVPGIVPDPTSGAMAIPDDVDDVRYCGDGDSEPFRTRCTLARAVARNARPGRRQSVIMAPSGQDLNDLVRGDHGR